MGLPTNPKEDGRITLSAKAVDTIRRRYWLGGWKQVELAEEHGITQGQVNNLVHGKSWQHRPFDAKVEAARQEAYSQKAVA